MSITITLQGLLALVPNGSITGEQGNPPTKLCALAPYTIGGRSPHPDDPERLEAHQPYLTVPAQRIGDPHLDQVRDLVEECDGQQARIEISGFRLHFVRDRKAEDPLQVEEAPEIIRLTELAPGYGHVDPQTVAQHPPLEKVAAQVLLTEGLLDGDGRTWDRFDTIDRDDKPVTSRLRCTLKADAIRVVLTPLVPNGQVRTVSTTGRIGVTNLCRREERNVAEIRIPDEDFKWYYRLFSDEDLTEFLKILEILQKDSPTITTDDQDLLEKLQHNDLDTVRSRLKDDLNIEETRLPVPTRSRRSDRPAALRWWILRPICFLTLTEPQDVPLG